jgi:hypothetical protein
MAKLIKFRKKNDNSIWWVTTLKWFFTTICYFHSNSFLCAQTTFIPIDNLCLNVDDTKVPLLILTGELHGISTNSSVETIFYNELILKHNVRTILIEEPYTNAYLINRYLTTGDTSFLNMYIADYPQKFVDVFERVKSLYKINKTLPENDKIRVISFDIWENIDTPFVIQLFKFLIKNEVSNNKLRSELLVNIETRQFPNNINQIDSLLNFYTSNDFAPEFDSIIKSYKYSVSNKNNLYKNRQEYLYKNILAKQYLFNGNVYSNMGYGHIDVEKKCTAYFLKMDTTFKYKITPYYPYYYHCKNLPWIKMRNSQGCNSFYFRYKVKKDKLVKGVYITERKGKMYIIHIGSSAQEEIK